VVRVGSFSKTVAPGLRLGWLTGSPGLVGRLADRGMLDSGGGVNHATALAMAEFGSSGAYDRHLVEIRQAYRGQRDAMVGALRERLPGLLTHEPHGGWFCWLRAPDGVPSAELATRAGAAGVSYVDGARFKIRNGGEAAMRLSYSLWPEPILTEGVARLAGALHRF
jgi:DNA-binding transcriptional MocR family regulator